MQIPIQRYFQVLVVGEEYAPVAEIIEKELGFRAGPGGADQASEGIHDGADLCAVVVGRSDASLVLAARHERGFEMPVFLVSERSADVFHAPYLQDVRGVLVAGLESRDFYKQTFLTSVEEYVQGLLTPFFGKLLEYDYDGNRSWACPGHQGGQMFRHHPVGRLFFEHMGENIFRDDICNAMVSLGDLLIREGPALAAQQEAARIFGAERERPIRVAIIEQCTYDGTIYNARTIVERIGHLCEYIHFDEAWAGFGAFHPLLQDHFSMGLELAERDPGIIATQSTHKQLAG